MKCKENFVIDYLSGVKISGGVKISYDILTPGSSWDSYWYCQNKSIIVQEPKWGPGNV